MINRFFNFCHEEYDSDLQVYRNQEDRLRRRLQGEGNCEKFKCRISIENANYENIAVDVNGPEFLAKTQNELLKITNEIALVDSTLQGSKFFLNLYGLIKIGSQNARSVLFIRLGSFVLLRKLKEKTPLR